MSELLSAREWLKKKRNEGCPQHGFHLANSLVKYSGYCKVCDRFWRFHRWIEKRNIPYWWYYFDPDTQKMIGKVYRGDINSGKQRNSRNKTTRSEHKGDGRTQQNNVSRSQGTDKQQVFKDSKESGNT